MKTTWHTLERPLAVVGALVASGLVLAIGVMVWFEVEERTFRRQWGRVVARNPPIRPDLRLRQPWEHP